LTKKKPEVENLVRPSLLSPNLGHDAGTCILAVCSGLEVVSILLAATEDEGLAAPTLHVEVVPLELRKNEQSHDVAQV
jgi:hypothetical protein